jgi:hypothetical protein
LVGRRCGNGRLDLDILLSWMLLTIVEVPAQRRQTRDDIVHPPGQDKMLVHTVIPESRWYVVESDKRIARLNMISHLLPTIPPTTRCGASHWNCPDRPLSNGYVRPPRTQQTYVPDHTASLPR